MTDEQKEIARLKCELQDSKLECECSILGISKSSYYHWLNTGPCSRWLENQKIVDKIRTIFKDSFGSYGSPRIKEELSILGYKVSRPRVARIMKALALYARRKRSFKITTDSNHKYPIAPNLLNRKVMGWSISDNLTTEDTINKAWNMAIRKTTLTKPLIFHSDRGVQYASYKFTNILKSYNGLVKQSMSRKGNCWDNAVAESFFKSLKVEWVYKHNYSKRSEAELSVFQWIETWYNKKRRHSYLGYKTINEFELNMYNNNQAA